MTELSLLQSLPAEFRQAGSGERYTYRQLRAEVRRLARGLHRQTARAPDAHELVGDTIDLTASWKNQNGIAALNGVEKWIHSPRRVPGCSHDAARLRARSRAVIGTPRR